MTSVLKIGLLAAAGSLVLASAAPAVAASAATDAFVANVQPNVDFLDDASRLALTRSASPKIKAFARAEAAEQTLAGNSLIAWAETHTPAGIAAAAGTAPALGVAVVAPVATVPLDVAANVTDGVGDVLTGRSVAIDAPLVERAPAVTVTRTAAPGTLLPSEETDMARLTHLTGRRFDAFFVTTQTDALRQLATLYTDYMRDGDDPALQAVAAHQLPIVRHRLEQLHAL